jgi:CBS-domain-containing membrane protein
MVEMSSELIPLLPKKSIDVEHACFEPQIILPSKGAITVTLSTALDKAYYLFTHLGLGMLVVTDDSNRLQGILTREHFKTVLHR